MSVKPQSISDLAEYWDELTPEECGMEMKYAMQNPEQIRQINSQNMNHKIAAVVLMYDR